MANVEGIDVTQKILVAQEELGLDVADLLTGQARAGQGIWRAAQSRLDNVVVTPALKLWHTFRSLEMFYGEAYASQLSARYATKRDQFHERAKWALERLVLTGLGIASSPIPRAAEPTVVTVEGRLADGTYYVAVAWSNERGEEGAPSVVTECTTAGSTLLVQVESPPSPMAGWNVYAGVDPAVLWRQNGEPIAVGLAWVQPNAIVTGGKGLGCGQAPSYLMPIPRVILRG
ncbi:MAG: hypothetical protein WDO73_10380 [Ignavibacteriota bacterium]